ncbi:unnamed protein product [Parnassius apollo]|uniref:(apollo) hypothetical protein n=1 Tax=Parnassius apollo TaxID=110799 RepID=A0A8S3WZ91_PARAO|nr:unnamed protein product [Parnassius apollo]
MKQAIDAVLSKTAGYRKAAHLSRVPHTTLERHVVAKIRKSELSHDSTPGNFKPVFSKQEEEKLVRYIIEMEKRLFGLTTIVLRKLAYQLAKENGKAHNFNHDKKIGRNSDFSAASTTDVPLANNGSETGPSNVGIQQQPPPPILEEHPLDADLPALTTPSLSLDYQHLMNIA